MHIVKPSKKLLKKCLHCGTPYRSYSITSKYCSLKCIGQAKSMRSGPLYERLKRYSLPNINGCIEWFGAKDEKGYGTLKYRHHPLANNSGNIPAHRAAYFVEHGNCPDNLCVLHKCDNPSCINPDHLFLGTQLDNNNDKVQKKRHTFGSKHYRTSLTEEKVSVIKQLYLQGMTPTPLAKKFGVPITTIENIVYGGKWAHVEPLPVDRLDAYCDSL